MKFSALASSSALALALALGLSACGDEDTGAGRDRPAATEITQEEGEASALEEARAENFMRCPR